MLNLLYCTSVQLAVSRFSESASSPTTISLFGIDLFEIIRVQLTSTVLGPLLFALLRGELPLLWSFTDTPAAEEDIKDDTIESPSEAAQLARAEARGMAEPKGSGDTSAPNGSDEDVIGATEPSAEQDDSWMNDPVGVAGGDGKARKRKNKKK